MLLFLLFAASVAPRTHYLDRVTVRESLWSADWSACAGADAGPSPLSFQILPDGSVAEVQAEGRLGDCASVVLGGRVFSPHDELPVQVRTTLVVRGGRVQPWPTLEVQQHAAQRLFIFRPAKVFPGR